MSLLHNRNAILACGTLVLLVMGLIYAWSIFVAPLEAEFGWTRSETSATFSVSMVLWSCGMLACGQLSGRLPVRVCFGIGVALIAGGFALSSAVHELWQLYIAYGLFCGFGTGLCYNLWTSTTFAHFPDRTGFASGVLLMGFGMGSMVLGSAASALVYSPLGWRGAFLVLAALVIAVAAAAMPFLRKPDSGAAHTAADRPAGIELSGTQMLKQPSFWSYTLWKVLVMGAAAAVIAQAAPLMADVGSDAALATGAVGALSVGNGCGRPVIGVIYDRIGRDRTILVLPVCGILAGIAVYASYLAGSPAALAVALFFEGVLYGGYASINTSFVRTTYGQAHVATNLGISSFTLMPFNAAFPVLAAALYMASGSYAASLAALPVIAAVSLAAGAATRRLVVKMNAAQAAGGQKA